MTALLYHPDIDAARDRLTAWWNGGDIGRQEGCFSSSRKLPVLAQRIHALPLSPAKLVLATNARYDNRPMRGHPAGGILGSQQSRFQHLSQGDTL